MARLRFISALVLILAVLAACSAAGDATDPDDGGDRVVVVTTFALLSEVAGQVGGDRVEVVNLIPVGVDEHAYQPSSTVPRDLARADLVIVNGYFLEESLLDIVVENVRPEVPVVSASSGLTPLAGGHSHEDEHGHEDEHAAEDEHGHEDSGHAPAEERGAEHIDAEVFAEGDPHFWLDARNMAAYAENIAEALALVDPEGAEEYRARGGEVAAGLHGLHDELLDTMAEIPADRRRLVVFHDAFQHFAAAYDFEVVASVAPANPNQARSAADIAAIIATVRETGVPTIYREPQYSAQSLDLIAADSGASIGIIHSIPSEDAPTYVEMMRANARALVEGLAG